MSVPFRGVNPLYGFAAIVATTSLLGYVALLITLDVLAEREVDAQTLAGGVAVYLLVGLIFALVIAVFRHYRTTEVNQLDQLKG